MQQTKRKDKTNNNILETFLKRFKEKDFNKNFKTRDTCIEVCKNMCSKIILIINKKFYIIISVI